MGGTAGGGASGGGMKVELQGMKALKRKLGGTLKPVRGLMEDAVEFVEDETRAGAKPHPGDLGTLAKGKHIRTSLASGPLPLEGRVFSRSPIVMAVDQGRRPSGKMAPITAIARWAGRHGIDKQRAFFIARSIGRRGSKAVRFFRAAAKSGEREMPKLVAKAARKIERDWGR